MKTIVVAALLAAGLGVTAARAADAGPAATVQTFIAAFNKGDIKAAEATHLPDAIIVDEMAPHLFRGPGGFQAWVAALTADSKARGRTDESVVLGQVRRQEIEGDAAYVILPADFVFKDKGVAYHEPSQMTAVLKKTAAGWKIGAWTWTGPRRQPRK